MYTTLIIFWPPWREELLRRGLTIIDYGLPSVGSVLVTLGPAGRTYVGREEWLCPWPCPCTRAPYNHQSSSKMISQMPCIINETAEHASDAAQ